MILYDLGPLLQHTLEIDGLFNYFLPYSWTVH